MAMSVENSLCGRGYPVALTFTVAVVEPLQPSAFRAVRVTL